MTHFMRFTLLGTIVAGGALAALAQEDIDALLGDLIEEPLVAEQALGDAVPADDGAVEALPAEDTLDAAESLAVEADIPAAEPEESAEDALADMPAAEPEAVADAEADADEVLADLLADEPASDPEVNTDDPIADEPAVAPEVVAETESASDPEPDEDVLIADEPAVTPEGVAEAEQPGPEPVAEDIAAAEPSVAEDDTEALLAGKTAADVEPVVTEEDRAFSELAALERIRQQGFDDYAKTCLAEATAAMNAQPQPPVGKAFDYYKAVIRKFEDAKTYLVERDDNIPLRTQCDQGIREAVYRQANALFSLQKYAEALELAQRCQKNGHRFGAELVAKITAAMNAPKQYIPEPEYPLHAEPEYREARLQRIERMQRATVYFHLGNYAKALEQVELVLRDDPDNEQAISLRARISQRKYTRAEQLRESMRDTMLAQVSANWTPLGYLAADSSEISAPKVTSSGNEEVSEDKEAKAAAQRVYEKLDYIILPEFSVGAPNTLDDVVKFFAELSRTYDKPELPPEERGVSFVLNWGKPQVAAPVEDDPFASDSGSSASGLPPIRSISLNYVTLREALNTVCTVTGAKYVIEGKTVMIVPTNYVDGKLEERWYNVLPEFADKMSGMSSDMGSSGDDSGGWGDDSGSSGGDTSSWKNVFSQFGVSFEGKASIAYFPQIGKIRVENTLENLARFESVLEKLNVTPFQIEVEARFVEVSQTDLNSLGFEWRLNQNITGTIGSGIDWASSAITGNNTGGDFAGGQDASGGYIFRRNSRSTGSDNIGMHAGAINNGMRFLGDATTAANRVNLGSATIAPDDTFATFSAVFGKLDMTMILHMLAQRSDTDMLSSPKVLVKSGQEAIFKVVTEWIYPTEFSIREIDTNNNNGGYYGNGGGTSTILPFMVEPQSFEKRDVGITMQVAPGISQEGQMIELSIGQLEVVEYLGDFDYGMEYPYSETKTTGLGDLVNITTESEVKFFHIPMPQPKFHVRTISTLLSIYNGATVVMGGLITERREAFEDKTPILGDLPFIGFLFRSEGEWSEKRNLLVFLTARLVDPAGRAIRTATDGTMGADDAFSGKTMSSVE